MESVGIQVFFKGGNILKSMLVAPKDKDPKIKANNEYMTLDMGRTVAQIDRLGKLAEPY